MKRTSKRLAIAASLFVVASLFAYPRQASADGFSFSLNSGGTYVGVDLGDRGPGLVIDTLPPPPPFRGYMPPPPRFGHVPPPPHYGYPVYRPYYPPHFRPAPPPARPLPAGPRPVTPAPRPGVKPGGPGPGPHHVAAPNGRVITPRPSTPAHGGRPGGPVHAAPPRR